MERKMSDNEDNDDEDMYPLRAKKIKDGLEGASLRAVMDAKRDTKGDAALLDEIWEVNDIYKHYLRVTDIDACHHGDNRIAYTARRFVEVLEALAAQSERFQAVLADVQSAAFKLPKELVASMESALIGDDRLVVEARNAWSIYKKNMLSSPFMETNLKEVSVRVLHTQMKRLANEKQGDFSALCAALEAALPDVPVFAPRGAGWASRG
jgi:hypothetical protein